MNAWIRRSHHAKGLFALLLLCALAIRIALPTGFMPTRSIHGIVISMCTGEGAVKAMLPIERDGGPAHHDKSRDGECAFAAGLGGGLIAPTLPTPLAALPMPARPEISRAIADLTVHRLAAPPPPSRGPPARA